jgi:hypothetical protein
LKLGSAPDNIVVFDHPGRLRGRRAHYNLFDTADCARPRFRHTRPFVASRLTGQVLLTEACAVRSRCSLPLRGGQMKPLPASGLQVHFAFGKTAARQ